tara:strand:- start:8978 stop:10330 length:1353 start_codon:yes stop_codon:yes gene_type:complete
MNSFSKKKITNFKNLKFLLNTSNFRKHNFGYISFLVGLFLLPSALSIGSIFLLISLIIGLKKFKQNLANENLNLIFLFGTIFIFISYAINFFINHTLVTIPYNEIYSIRYLSTIGLVNWIPLIFAFFIFQNYLSNDEERKRCAIALILGSIPVFFSCFSQFLFDWDETLKTFYGLIVWYQKPLNKDIGISGISGLFSNANYLAAWLIIIWPFCLSFLIENKKPIKRIFNFFLVILVGMLIVLSSSRVALFFLIFPLLIIYRVRIKKLFLGLLGIFSLVILNLSIPIFGINFQSFIREIVPRGIWLNFTKLDYAYKLEYDLSRSDIWIETFKLILKKPLIGYGSNTFSPVFFNETGYWKGHAHNLPIELIFNYGIPTALFILLPILFIIFKSIKQTLLIENNSKVSITKKGWIIALISIMGMQLVDIQYFDARISIIGWILLAGALKIIED